MRIPAALIAVMGLGCIFPVHAQENRESRPAVYKVEFDIREGSEGTAQSSQHYSMLIDESRKGVFRVGNRVPFASGSLPQHVDVGVNIECTVHESDGKVALSGGIELTRITGQVILSTQSQPIIGQRIIAFDRIVKLGLPTVIMDDRKPGTPDKPLASAATRQVEATVTKVN